MIASCGVFKISQLIEPRIVRCSVLFSKPLHFAETFASFMGSSGLASRRTGKEEKEMLPQAILRRIRVRIIFTTDDPSDDLRYHEMAEKIHGITFLPAFRPDSYSNIFSDDWRSNVERICQLTGEDTALQGLVEALRKKDVLARSLIISHGD